MKEGREGREGKGRKGFPNKNQEVQYTGLKLYFGILFRKIAYLFLCFKLLQLLLGFTAIFIKEPNVCVV